MLPSFNIWTNYINVENRVYENLCQLNKHILSQDDHFGKSTFNFQCDADAWYNTVNLCAIHLTMLSVTKSRKVNVKCTVVQALRFCTGCTVHRGSRGIAVLFLDHGTRRGWGVSVTHRRLFTSEKTWYSLYRRLGGPQGRSGKVRKISSPPGFDPWTFRPVASRFTDWANRPTRAERDWKNIKRKGIETV